MEEERTTKEVEHLARQVAHRVTNTPPKPRTKGQPKASALLTALSPSQESADELLRGLGLRAK